MTGPRVLYGDFNTTRHPSEKKNCHRISKAKTDLSKSIEDMEPMDLDLKGGKYTWGKGDRRDTIAILDRILILEDPDSCF